MNEEQILKRLAGAASGNGPPPIDVVEKVLADLPAQRRPQSLLLWGFATVSAAAAVIVVFLALRAMAHQADPFAELFAPMMGMIQ